MTSDEGRTPEGAPERSPKSGVGAPSGVDGNGPKRFSVGEGRGGEQHVGVEVNAVVAQQKHDLAFAAHISD